MGEPAPCPEAKPCPNHMAGTGPLAPVYAGGAFAPLPSPEDEDLQSRTGFSAAAHRDGDETLYYAAAFSPSAPPLMAAMSSLSPGPIVEEMEIFLM